MAYWLLLRNRWLQVSLYIACNVILEKAAASSLYMSCNQLQGVAASQQVVFIERWFEHDQWSSGLHREVVRS